MDRSSRWRGWTRRNCHSRKGQALGWRIGVRVTGARVVTLTPLTLTPLTLTPLTLTPLTLTPGASGSPANSDHSFSPRQQVHSQAVQFGACPWIRALRQAHRHGDESEVARHGALAQLAPAQGRRYRRRGRRPSGVDAGKRVARRVLVEVEQHGAARTVGDAVLRRED